MLAKFIKVGNSIGIDKAIGFTLLTRLVQALGAVGVVIFIALYLSSDEQGYYYTFGSIIAIQVFFELGLGTIITQYAAHEFAHLKFDDDLNLSGKEIHISRLSSLLHFCVKWFGCIAFLLFIGLIGAGFYFFSNFSGGSENNIAWKTPWIILSLSTSLNLFIDPILAFLEGVSRIKEMAKIRLAQKTVNMILLFVMLVTNFKLYSSAVASLVAVVLIFFMIFFSLNYKILKEIWRGLGNWKINYYKEIFPFQWRIALSWLSGYFIFQLFNPVLFATEGAAVAGKMGMTLAVLNGISGLSMSWISTKVPIFSSLISRKLYSELDSVFNKTLKNLNIVNTIFLIFFICLIVMLDYLGVKLRDRFLPILPLIALSFTVFLNQFVFSWATYMRCQKQEPLLIQSIIGAIYCSLSTYFFGKFFGLNGIVIGYTFWIIITVVWVHSVYVKNKLALHANYIPE